MEKEHRSGVDVRVALNTYMKRAMVAAASRSVEPVADQSTPAVPAPASSDTTVVEDPKTGFWLRLFKPLLRPILFPVRRFFTIKLQEELQRMQQETRALLQTQQQENERRHATTVQLIQTTSGELSAAARATREDLKSTIARLEGMAPRLDRIEQYGYASNRRVAVSCGSDTVLVRSAVGYVLCSASDYTQLTCLVDTGETERGTRLLIERLLGPGDTFVDVGANLGLHTLAAARAMKGRGRIVAFEPFGPTFELLQKSIWLNGFSDMVESHQSAVSNHSGRQQLHLGMSSGHHSLFPLALPSGFKSELVEVPVVKLDDVLASFATVEMIKIDVEGAELEVLDGAAAVIKRSPEIALIVEFGPAHLRRTNHSSSEWFARFAALGLKYRAINDETGALEDRSLEQLERTESTNLLFSRPEGRAWRKAEVPA